MTVDRGSSSPRRTTNAGSAGNEAIGSPRSSQFPTTETPLSLLRNALAKFELGRVTHQGRNTLDDGLPWFALSAREQAEVYAQVRHAADLLTLLPSARHARELEDSAGVAAQLLETIGAQAAAALTADLLLALTAEGYLTTWSVEPTTRALRENVRVVTPGARAEIARRRHGHASQLEEMDRTNRELTNLRLAVEGPDELADADRDDDATGRPS